MAVAIPIRTPPNAVAKNTAGIYGVKNMSGRIRAKHHRAAVDNARQEAANPVLKAGVGWDIPCQPLRNSSINFTMRRKGQPISESPEGEYRRKCAVRGYKGDNPARRQRTQPA
jgi:hypothetical protein